ncbi:MAG: hypothetical protein EXS25_07610 [Pedosphaera sp.]|nr:hypothetical protein [Pedosphaera sp.]
MSENDFKALRSLLRMKRNEKPPPGYFQSFTSEVMTRVKFLEQDKAQVGWFFRVSRWLWASWLKSESEIKSGWNGLVRTSALTVVGVSVATLCFSFFLAPEVDSPVGTSVEVGSSDASAAATAQPSLPRRQSSLLSVVEPANLTSDLRIRTLDLASTNLFPDGLFRIPDQRSVRVGFGSNGDR